MLSSPSHQQRAVPKKKHSNHSRLYLKTLLLIRAVKILTKHTTMLVLYIAETTAVNISTEKVLTH